MTVILVIAVSYSVITISIFIFFFAAHFHLPFLFFPSATLTPAINHLFNSQTLFKFPNFYFSLYRHSPLIQYSLKLTFSSFFHCPKNFRYFFSSLVPLSMAGNGNCAANEYGDGVAWVRGPIVGKGSFGRVYRATLKNPRSKYSCFPPVMAVKTAEVSCSGTIQKERGVLSNLSSSSYLIKCFGEETTVGENGVMAYNLLLEYGSGGTLSELIKKSGGTGLPENVVRAHARSILRGLNHVHGMGYVHCDLKPDNILIVGVTAKIGDFGLAKRGKGSNSKKRKVMEAYWRGTPMYLSPEAVTDCLQEAPCDVWSVGCIVLEMLTGKPVWDEENAEEILAKIGAGNEMPMIPDEVSEDARDFLKRCFVRKSKYRFTAEMLLNHPFIEGLDEDDSEGFEEVDSIYGSDDDEFISDGDEESESQEAGGSEVVIGWSSEEADCDQSISENRCCSVIFSIPAGV